MAHINKYIYTKIYIPQTGVYGNMKFSIHLHTEGSLLSPIRGAVAALPVMFLKMENPKYLFHIRAKTHFGSFIIIETVAMLLSLKVCHEV